jgi:phospholysine phosphohistidine inorganic pyrophosphate phosphatase
MAERHMVTQKQALLIDLDGVLYQESQLIPGALKSMRWIESEQIEYLFITNTTSRSRNSLLKKFDQMGFHTSADRIVTPIVAASKWLRQHSITLAAFFVKADACTDFFGIEAVDAQAESGAEAVVIGDLGDNWDYPTLNRAFRLLMHDPKPVLIALGMTRYWQSADGLSLDVAPFIKALEHAASCEAEVIGKPSASFYQSALALLGYPASQVIMIGDDIVGDVEGAQLAGIRALLVKTGKFRMHDLDSSIKPDGVLDSFANLPDWWRANVNSGS